MAKGYLVAGEEMPHGTVASLYVDSLNDLGTLEGVEGMDMNAIGAGSVAYDKTQNVSVYDGNHWFKSDGTYQLNTRHYDEITFIENVTAEEYDNSGEGFYIALVSPGGGVAPLYTLYIEVDGTEYELTSSSQTLGDVVMIVYGLNQLGTRGWAFAVTPIGAMLIVPTSSATHVPHTITVKAKNVTAEELYYNPSIEIPPNDGTILADDNALFEWGDVLRINLDDYYIYTGAMAMDSVDYALIQYGGDTLTSSVIIASPETSPPTTTVYTASGISASSIGITRLTTS